MGVLGIVIGLAIMMYLAYKGVSVFYAAPVSALIVALFGGVPLLPAYATTYMKGTAGFFQNYFPIFLLGAIIGKIYADSGAGVSVAHGIMNLFQKEGMSEQSKQLIAITVIVLAGSALGYGGINVMVLIFTMYPVALSFIKEANIPKRFLPAIILTGLAEFSMTGPGSPQIQNLIPAKTLGTSATAGLFPGMVGLFFVMFACIWYLNRAITKAKQKGERFEYGPNDAKYKEITIYPAFWAALLPLLTVFTLFNIFKQDILISLAAGIILSLALFWKYLYKGNLGGVVEILNGGALASAAAVINVSAMVGFGSVVQAVPAFKTVVNAMIGLGGSPLIMASIAVAVIAGVTGSASGGLGIALPLVAPVFVGQMGVDPNALHRVVAFASSALDTLPANGALIMLFNYSGCTHKESYGPTFITTVLIATLATALVVALCLLFPTLV